MERYTKRAKSGFRLPLERETPGAHVPYWRLDYGEFVHFYLSGDAVNRLAAYEDTGLTPEQVKDAIRIAERIATANYPHNLQRERSDIVAYMRWITDVMRDAKTWWNGRIASRAETEATLKQEVEEE